MPTRTRSNSPGTRLPTHRRLALALAAAGLLSGLGAMTVGALEGEPFRVAENEPGGGTYGPIVASDPATVTVDGSLVTPEDCAVMPSCYTIPFEIVVPEGLSDADDFSAAIAVGWDDPEHLSDLDVFVWDDGGQKVEEAEEAGEEPPENPSKSPQGDSASSANPEIVRLFEPSYEQYHLVVFNFLGPPISFVVYGELVVDEFSTPFELLAPERTPPTSQAPRQALTPSTAPAATTPPTTQAATTATTTPVLPPLALDQDDDFASFDEADFEDQLVPELSDQDMTELAALVEVLNRPEAPPSTAALLLGLVVTPALFLSAAGAWMWRRSPAGIDID